jgi:hypothetical protein
MSKYWSQEKKLKISKNRKKKLKRFVKGSKQAKSYMSKMRGIRTGKVKERKRTYYNGLYTRKKKKKELIW